MAKTTTALVAKKLNAPPSWETVQLDDLQPDEVLVEMTAVGVCHTDISCMNGTLPTRFPCVLGHEGGGTVVGIGSGIKHVAGGDRVLLSFAHCGACVQCKEGFPGYCLEFISRNFGQARPDSSTALSFDGQACHGHFFGQSSFMRLAVAHASSVVKVAPDSDLALYAPLGCGLQTGAGCIFNTLDVQPGKSVVVWGAGAVGMAAVMAAKIRGAGPIIAVDLQQSRLDLAKQLGATHGILGSDSDVVEQIQKLCPPNGCDYAAECTGVPKVVETMLDSLGTRGKAASIGAPTPGQRAAVDIYAHLTLRREYIGCTEGDSIPSEFIPRLIELHKQGKFPLEKLISFYDVSQVEQAMADAKSGKTVKPVLKWP